MIGEGQRRAHHCYLRIGSPSSIPRTLRSYQSLIVPIFAQSISLVKPPPPLVAQTDYAFLNKISKHAIEPLSVILQLEPKKLAHPSNVPTTRVARVSPSIAKDSTVTPAFRSLELSSNVVPAPSAFASEQNEEWVNAMVDGLNAEMTDGAAHSKSGGSERVSFGLIDVVVTLSASEKGDGFLPFSTVDEEATTNPSRV
ncbi:hypothetical protein Tco_0982125 [Tanacetum coccineum]